MGLDDIAVCLQKLKACDNDSDKIAVLCILSKLLQVNNVATLSGAFRNDIAAALGSDFINMLLLAEDENPDCLCKATAFGVLSCLLEDDNVSSSGFFNACILNCAKALDSLTNEVCCEDKIIPAIKDGCLCLRSFLSSVSDTALRLQLIQKIAVLKGSSLAHKDVVDCYADLLLASLSVVSVDEAKGQLLSTVLFDALLDKVIGCMKVCQSKTSGLFARLVQLIPLLEHWLPWRKRQNIPECSSLKLPAWAIELRIIARGILQSKLPQDLKNLALRLAALNLSAFGVAWICSDSEFLQILVSLASIELQLRLRDACEDFTKPQDESAVVCCCSLLEDAIRIVADNDSELTLQSKQLSQLVSTFVELMRSIGSYFLQWSRLTGSQATAINVAFTLCLFRVMCASLADACELVKTELLVGLPALIKLAAWAKERDDAEFDSIGLLLPGLSHMTADSDLIRILLEANVAPLLMEYFRDLIVLLRKTTPCNLNSSTTNVEGVLVVLLNLLIAVEDTKCSSNSTQKSRSVVEVFLASSFAEDFVVLSDKLSPSFHLNEFPPNSLKAHFVAVQLQAMFLCLLADKSERLTTSSFRLPIQYLQAFIPKELCEEDIDHSGLLKTPGVVVELWCSSFRVLTKCVSLFPNVSTVIESAGWIPQMLECLAQHAKTQRSGPLATLYGELLGALRRV